MTTPVVDIHAHFSPPTTQDQREALWKLMHSAHILTSEPPHWTPEATLDVMDRTGVAMQILSSVPPSREALRAFNDYGATLVAEHPTRFGLLAALPTDDPDACLTEISRADGELGADGFAVLAEYHGVWLGDARLEPVWAALDRRGATVFVHPNPFAPPTLSRPSILLDVALETARSVTDLLYAGVLRRHPRVRLVIAHCGGALPALAGRLLTLGTETWVPNPNQLTRDELRTQLAGLYLDTAASGEPQPLAAALAMTSADHLIYGSDWGAPCTTETTMQATRHGLANTPLLTDVQRETIWRNALNLLPTAAKRVAEQQTPHTA
ncbi:amidohydrolase family protein [Actinomadura nitritigenes]|uniref:amidohydrolase family protein n=1 Tax=Actinomadura nitritigenes TaxID=134602 RepID=UPI003D8C3BCB